jgi:hypothetical protein
MLHGRAPGIRLFLHEGGSVRPGLAVARISRHVGGEKWRISKNIGRFREEVGLHIFTLFGCDSATNGITSRAPNQQVGSRSLVRATQIT